MNNLRAVLEALAVFLVLALLLIIALYAPYIVGGGL